VRFSALGDGGAKLAAFDAHWAKCRADARLPAIKAFRDKYTAHLGEPKEIEKATYSDVFAFGAETAKAMELLALATGVAVNPISTNPDLVSAPEAFWAPWKDEGVAGLPRPSLERMRVARRAQAAQFAANVLPIIRDVQAAGHTSLNAIARQLNARKVPRHREAAMIGSADSNPFRGSAAPGRSDRKASAGRGALSADDRAAASPQVPPPGLSHLAERR
jgi:hypothetical protein